MTGLQSMTAFAAREGSDGGGITWSWEMRGVNGRGLDLRLRLPDGQGALEQQLRAALGKALTRGNVTLNLRFHKAVTGAGDAVNAAALAQTLDALHLVQEAAADKGVTLAAPSAAEIMTLRGVLDAEAGTATPEAAILMADAGSLIDDFVAMRRVEGQALADILSDQLDGIAGLVNAAVAIAAERPSLQADRLAKQVAALLETTDAIDEGRLAQELALLAVKSDVTEEIDRLRAHVGAARDLVAGGGPIGRKLDFLMQEFNREANTLCSKSGHEGLTAIGLDLKLAIDQMREQVQNVE